MIQRGGQQPAVDLSSTDKSFHNGHTTQELAFQDTQLGGPYLDSYAPQGDTTGHVDLSFTVGATKNGSAVNVSMDTSYISRTGNVNQDCGKVKFDYGYPDSLTKLFDAEGHENLVNLTTVGWVEVDQELGLSDSVCDSLIKGEFAYDFSRAGRVNVGSGDIDLSLNGYGLN